MQSKDLVQLLNNLVVHYTYMMPKNDLNTTDYQSFKGK
jgi:hypothetical protein